MHMYVCIYLPIYRSTCPSIHGSLLARYNGMRPDLEKDSTHTRTHPHPHPYAHSHARTYTHTYTYPRTRTPVGEVRRHEARLNLQRSLCIYVYYIYIYICIYLCILMCMYMNIFSFVFYVCVDRLS